MINKEDTPITTNHASTYGSASTQSNNTNTINAAGVGGGGGGGGGAGAGNNSRTPYNASIYCLHGQNKIEVRDHCHRQRSEGVDVTARRKLIIASIICVVFMTCEIIGGILSNSLAIATDAAHLLTDLAGFLISLFAIWLAGRPSTQRMSFGWYRAEVIGALASVVTIWFITAILVWLAVERIINQDFELDAKIMLITSGLAIIVNIIMGVQLQHGHMLGHSHSHGIGDHSNADNTKGKWRKLKKSLDDLKVSNLSLTLTSSKTNKSIQVTEIMSDSTISIDSGTPPLGRSENGVDVQQLKSNGPLKQSYQNSHTINDIDVNAIQSGGLYYGHDHNQGHMNINVRAAFIHVLGDIIQSVGVFLAAICIYFKPEWVLIDPICTFIFSIIVLCTTFAIMKEALLVLMEGTPNFLHYAEILNIFEQIEGVKRVHNLRIWALSLNKVAISVHLAIADGTDPKQILKEATTAVHMRYNFFETTIQIENFTSDMEGCQQCTTPAV